MPSPNTSSVTVWPVLSGLPSESVTGSGDRLGREGADREDTMVAAQNCFEGSFMFTAHTKGGPLRIWITCNPSGGAVITCNYSCNYRGCNYRVNYR